MAHIAVAGPDPQPSPLSVANTQVSVSSNAAGFRVTVRSAPHDRDVAHQVVDKGQELADSTYGQGRAPAIGVASNQ
jgi:hypothetical protein